MLINVGVHRRRFVFRMERSISGVSKSNGRLKCESLGDSPFLGAVEVSNENRKGTSLVRRVDRRGHKIIAQTNN